MKYLITQSLLSAWLYLFNCTEDNSEEARKDFLASLRREESEQSEEMLRGISFEDAVNAYLHGDNEAPERHAAEYSRRGRSKEDTAQYAKEEAACVRKVAEIMRGGTYQLTAYKDKRIAGINFLLMAKCDWVKAGIIKDCKRVTNYEPGKYLNSAQHPMYLEVLDTAYKFDYVVCDGSDVYTTDSYTRADIPQTIDELITQFVEFLKSENLLETYFEYWKSKY